MSYDQWQDESSLLSTESLFPVIQTDDGRIWVIGHDAGLWGLKTVPQEVASVYRQL